MDLYESARALFVDSGSIGDLRSTVIARHGRSLLPPGSDESGPIGSDEDGTPGNWRPPGPDGRFGRYPRDVGYRESAYLVEQRRRDPRAYGFIVTDARAQTLKGMGVGDTLAFAVERYPQMRCDVVGPANEAVRLSSRPAVHASHRVDTWASVRTRSARSHS